MHLRKFKGNRSKSQIESYEMIDFKEFKPL